MNLGFVLIIATLFFISSIFGMMISRKMYKEARVKVKKED